MSKKKRDLRNENGKTKQGGADQRRPDTSPFVYQEKKLDFELNIREFEWTEKQKVFIETALDKNTSYILCEAPPGVGKTLLAVYIGLRLLQQKRISNIYFVRLPMESASKGIGFLAGDIESKVGPYSQPMVDHLNELLPPSQISRLMKEGFIQTIPVGFIKGRTFNASLIIVDEIEDLTTQECLLVMGRLGKFSKMIMTGDYEQANIRNSGFKIVYNLFNDMEAMQKGIFCLQFDESDIMRNGLLSFVVKRFRQIRN